MTEVEQKLSKSKSQRASVCPAELWNALSHTQQNVTVILAKSPQHLLITIHSTKVWNHNGTAGGTDGYVSKTKSYITKWHLNVKKLQHSRVSDKVRCSRNQASKRMKTDESKLEITLRQTDLFDVFIFFSTCFKERNADLVCKPPSVTWQNYLSVVVILVANCMCKYMITACTGFSS